jgi:hypothetical protein
MAESTLLEDFRSICHDIHERWDADMRSGKLLMAMLGAIKNYDPRVTRVRAALVEIDDLRAEVKRLRDGILDVYVDMPHTELKARLARVGSKAPQSKQPMVDVEEWLGRQGQ